VKKSKIYMVDNDADLVKVVKWVFEAEGYDFASAGSAKEGLQLLDQVAPDLIILDVMMEDPTAGFRVVNTLRNYEEFPMNRKYERIPILLLTGIQRHTKMKVAPHVGGKLLSGDAFLEKPVKPKQLLDKVAELLQKTRAASP
jgi:CheY-like chemotaxis protein